MFKCRVGEGQDILEKPSHRKNLFFFSLPIDLHHNNVDCAEFVRWQSNFCNFNFLSLQSDHNCV